MASNAVTKPETLTKSSTAAPVLVTVPASSNPGSVPASMPADNHQETPIIPVTTLVDEGEALKLSSSDEGQVNEHTAGINGLVPESAEVEPSFTIAIIENSSPATPDEGNHTDLAQRQSTALPNTQSNNTKNKQLQGSTPSSAGKPYQHGIQVPSHMRVAEGFPYPPGLSAYEISEEDWKAFTVHLTTLISPHGRWLKNVPIRLVPPFGVRDEKRDFQKSLSKVFEYVRKSQNNIFLPKGLLMRVDVPGDGVGMEFMDLYHRKHVDHLPNMPKTEVITITPAPQAISDATDATSNLTEQPVQSDKVQKDKTHENARKEKKRTQDHLNSAQKKMAKRIRIVMEPVTVLEEPERAERNGWMAWVRHCDNYGSQLAT